MNHILRVGVTGGIGSGKSLVCSFFSRLGVPVLSADDIAKDLMRNDASLRRALRALLGNGTYRPDGEVDRHYVAGKIFSDSALQRRVNALVHPRVRARVEKQFVELGRAGEKIGIIEAALIYEAGFEKHLDCVVVVDAPETQRIQRVVNRDKTTPEAIRRRMRAQLPAGLKVRKADYVIRNSGSIGDLKTAVRFLHTILQHIAEEK
ncbi:MAG: dephospho-CoA kinase [Ignavibacteria bacterium]|nr:dephospho-CoA kinase [Ignavibacteria bacterium]